MAATIAIRRAPVLALLSLRNTKSVAKTTTPSAAICIRGKSKIRIHQASFLRRGRRVVRTTTIPKMLTARLTSGPPDKSTGTIAVYQESSRIRKRLPANGPQLVSSGEYRKKAEDRPQLLVSGFSIARASAEEFLNRDVALREGAKLDFNPDSAVEPSYRARERGELK